MVVDKLQHVPQTIMVTSAAIVRGVRAKSERVAAKDHHGTALVHRPAEAAKVFAPSDLEAAFAALELGEPVRERINRQITELGGTVDADRAGAGACRGSGAGS